MSKLWQLPSGAVFERVRDVPSLETLALSHDRQWPGLSCTLVFGNMPGPMAWQTPDTILSFLLTGSAVIEWKQGSVVRHRPWSAGSICLLSGNEPHDVRVSGRVLTLNCALSPELLRWAGRLQCGCGHAGYRVTSRIGFQDSDLWHIGRQLRSELTAPSRPDRPQQELLNLALCDYVLRHSGTCRQCPICASNHGSGPGLHQERVLEGLRRAIGFIGQHLGEDGLSIERIAAEIGMSPYHFARMFRAALGSPPHRYIVEQRMIRAQKLLEHSVESAADVALLCGFSSQSHLTSTFRRLLGTTPLAYRRKHRKHDQQSDEPSQSSWRLKGG